VSSLFHTDFGAEGTVGWTDDDDDVDGCDGDTMIQSMKKKKKVEREETNDETKRAWNLR